MFRDFRGGILRVIPFQILVLGRGPAFLNHWYLMASCAKVFHFRVYLGRLQFQLLRDLRRRDYAVVANYVTSISIVPDSHNPTSVRS